MYMMAVRIQTCLVWPCRDEDLWVSMVGWGSMLLLKMERWDGERKKRKTD